MLYTFKNPLQKNKKKCLFKLIVNGKYLIFKCLELDPFLARISIQLDKEVQVIKESSVFVNLVKEISKKKIGIIDVEILGTYESSFDILVSEYNALMDAAKDPKCLNVSFSNHEYYPNWIDQSSINSFKDYYTKGKNNGASAKDKRFRRFIRDIAQKDMYLDDFVNKVCAYVKKNYK